uniref:Reverse transcriptase domain-containing protein n=1 Tax=Tanacetum cinerariifolium TaxID=118510 RepID=A0A6L2JNU3_TANCI|nr:reverse transcriptase domain-containing protein [Tanacetum cinerariifolium]
MMADNRTMAELLRAPTEGYAEAIVVLPILAEQFELKHSHINMMTTDQFFGLEKDNPHDHIHQDSLNAAAGSNLLERSTQDVLMIIENKSKVRNSQIKPLVSQVKACDDNSNSEISKLTHAVNQQTSVVTIAMTAMLKQFQATPPPAPVKAVEEICVTCGGAHPYYQCLAAGGNTFPKFEDNIQGYVSTAAVNYNQANPAQQNQNFHLNELEKIKRINKANMKAMQTQIDMVKNELRNEMKSSIQTSLSNQTNEIKNMMASLLQMNTASTSSSGTLPSNTVANPKGDLKAITTRSGVSYNGPSIPPPMVENEPEATKDTVNPTNNGNTKDVQPQVVQSKPFSSTLKALIGNKEKLSEMARTPLNEHYFAVLLKKLPEKLGDSGKFLISCDFLGMAKCLALADLGASINLMPYSVWKKLSLLELTPTYFVVVDFDADPRVPLILERSFLKTGKALIDVFEGELTLRVGKEAITFNLDQTSRYSANYNDMTAKRIDVIDMACEEYSQEVLGFFDTISSGNPTPCYDPIISTTSSTLTQGGILLLEAFLNDDPSSPPPNQRNYMPNVSKELKMCEAETKKSSIDEPPVVELKSLPPHLEYEFLEGDDKLPVIIAKYLSVDEKTALITVLNPVHCVPKKGGFTVVENEENELIPLRLVTGWRVCIDYRKLNKATWKDHIPLPFMDQMLERLAGNKYCCFLDGFSGYFQILIDLKDQEKTTFTCPYETFAYRGMPFGLCNAPGTFQRCMMAIFHDMIEKTMEVFMDDFSVFGNSFQCCLSYLEKMLKRCEDTNLCLNWEKSHLMVKEGIVLGHKIYEKGIKVDKAKVDVISKLPHPTTVKGIRSFLGHAGFYRRFIKDFSKIARPMTSLLEKDTPFIFSQEKPLIFSRLATLDRPEATMDLITLPERAIISDRGMHFCNDQFTKVMQKYSVNNRLSTPYHLQTSGQVKVSNRGLKRILERAVGWSDKLDDALWAFRTPYKTPIGCTPYKLVYGKACHLPVELEHKAYWALKHANFNLKTAGDHRKIQINELNELRDQAYENSWIYKEKTKMIHDSKIKNRVFNVGDRFLLFNSRLKIFSGKLKGRWSGPFTIS